jgi:hypothetical protein
LWQEREAFEKKHSGSSRLVFRHVTPPPRVTTPRRSLVSLKAYHLVTLPSTSIQPAAPA